MRHFRKPERINEYLRITIGTDEQMQTFVDFLKDYINNKKWKTIAEILRNVPKDSYLKNL